VSAARKLDLTSVIGVPIGLGCILAGQMLEGGTIQSILQFTAAIIVFGGTLGAVLLSFTLAEVRRAWFALREVFWDQQRSADETIGIIGRFATKARRDGIMSLEDEVDQVADPFMKRGFMLAVDGTNPSTLRAMLDAESGSLEDAEESPAKVYEAAGGYAPTVGILGAVLGLIHVMENLSDPNKLGAGIAVAFVATVYGVGSANLLFLPIASKLRTKALQKAKHRELVMEGILAIQEGQNPRLIDQKLRGLLSGDESVARTAGKSARAA
jgi:chemotaxis protein MotA